MKTKIPAIPKLDWIIGPDGLETKHFVPYIEYGMGTLDGKRTPKVLIDPARMPPRIRRKYEDWLARQAVASPRNAIVVKTRGGRWMVTQGERTFKWCEEDVPGLGRWVRNLVQEVETIKKVARQRLQAFRGQSTGGRKSTGPRQTANKRADIQQAAQRYLEMKRDPLDHVRTIAKRIGCSERYVRAVLKKP